MSDRGQLAVGIVLVLAAVCGLLAWIVPSMRKVFKMLFLSLALLECGGMTIALAFWGINHRHLSVGGFAVLLVLGYATWMIIQYLLGQIGRPKLNSLS
jgi:hypothetical protein